ncbi:MAG: serine/threonine-protein kinase [Bryobacteraceae bacterium]
MTPERWAQVRQVFDGALERPAKDRAAYLRVVCSRDDELRKEVESLLASHEGDSQFLETPAAQINRASFSFTREEELAEYPAGYKLGPYQFEKRIGRGGMGSVWLATRCDHEYRKEVAIKLVKRGMDSSEILRRFRMERQVLASLDHPNIAVLIDGGSTPEGLPYLVMEYIEGDRIDHYCESHKLSITQRLLLFRAVCAAVQFAHQNLVVHRDIKAANILVTPDGVPKLLDFGIAKLLRHDNSTLDMSQTRPELRPMTLDYASPEQIRGEAITTATDVYSLGVLLYKMLTGKMPYGAAGNTQAGLRNAILETDPVPPSQVVLTDEKIAIPEATQKIEIVTESRATARKRLRNKLAGDLDGIILKSLRKEPHRRYASVEQFSEDIRRYIERRPVIARMDTPGYRWAKFVKRNAIGVAAGIGIGLLLTATAAVSLRSSRETSAALAETQRRYLSVEREMMHSANALGEAQIKAGDNGTAFISFNRALQLAADVSAAESGALGSATPDTQMAAAEANARMGEILVSTGTREAAIARFAKAKEIYQQLPQTAEVKAFLEQLDESSKLARAIQP